MSEALNTAKLIWGVLKDGAKTDVSGTTVSIVPKDTTVANYTDWQGPTCYAEGNLISLPPEDETQSAIQLVKTIGDGATNARGWLSRARLI